MQIKSQPLVLVMREEIKDPYYSEGLHSILLERSADLIGVLNGIDTKEYNPQTDPAIAVNYRSSRAKKKENKMTDSRETRIAD